MSKQENIIRLTKQGEKKLREELDLLLGTQRLEMAEKIKEARSFGDLSENSEYDAARDEQAVMEARITEIQYTLAHAEIVDDEDISIERVGIGLTVKILDIEMDEEMEFSIVGTKEADIDDGKMSDESPIGRAITGHEVGEIVDVETPDGVIQVKILEIRKD